MGYFQEKYEQSDFNLGEYVLFLVVLICFMYYTCLITPGLEDDRSLRHPSRHRSSDAWCVVRRKKTHRQQPSFTVAPTEIPNSVVHENSHAASVDVSINSVKSKRSQYAKCIPHKSVTRLKMLERELLFEDEYFDGTAKDSDDNSLEGDFGINACIYYFIQLV